MIGESKCVCNKSMHFSNGKKTYDPFLFRLIDLCGSRKQNKVFFYVTCALFQMTDSIVWNYSKHV
ncbi:hypothetical protein C0J52_20094 [Blattella germanica]|nr:hypothetical protein C0J52_20094 [Blattella germanica]